MNFLASPDIVTAMVLILSIASLRGAQLISVIVQAFSGKLSFDPTKDELIGADGKPFRFSAPVGDELPSRGFTSGR